MVSKLNYNPISRIIKYAGMGIALLIASIFFYLWYTYIDETITSGEAFGFIIGDDKLETYKKAPGNLARLTNYASTAFIEIRSEAGCAKLLATEPGYRVMVEASLDDVGYLNFKSKNQWDFFIDGSNKNSLTLKFCNEKLCEIYRHRQNFEIP